MRIPPFFSRKEYQRFLAGIFLGFLVGWLFFLLQYGWTVEHYVRKIDTQARSINDLKEQISQWKSTYEKNNAENEKKLRLQRIKVFATKSASLSLSQLKIYHISEDVQDQLENLLGEDLDTIHKTRALIYKAIENKIYELDGESYRVRIDHLFLYTSLEVHVKIVPES
ncbi:hypothetical protein A374_09433 [Fictibacillus macauensis ZFHKF-1]|uniref:Sporulation membrane protein YtrI C-terminal domain-containing protein n=1 Tax=Fictibacillus macauensis ZFHKF-1 TaxID=1196324 RepID=I8UF84_9BACL|nr:sporulation membrane protein YtrI [Fictibacillus macauensis]EIT85448.1 hypothetical protein A374_09433 [Fictibacillus macauensis ZFHKF-1]